MRRLIALAAALVAASGVASACSCLPQTHAEKLEAMDAIFVGRVMNTSKPKTFEGKAITDFHVLDAIKGDLGRIVTIRHDIYGPACGVRFAKGTELTVYAYGEGDDLRTNSCAMMVVGERLEEPRD
ncbi:hypothetical protein HK107_14020 [Parvularcula sp. ZS-1/3]|uniref:Uncharacterized protein n=1 Tax=Parvularcula mediterranea TaxID=2732508 RepID=A0A7Y3RPI9_9PROT|nr:hypothetical protein [Parvularcula mediterranea]NNU17445.1 hypothetical protein [Parvularcula mediterranea]